MSQTPSAALIDKCVHCGFCLPTCPTYMLWGEEMDSPRGRIYLMKAAIEGRATIDASFVRHFDACLGCLNCVTACPSGVQYAPLIERTRAQIEQSTRASQRDRAIPKLLLALIPYPAGCASRCCRWPIGPVQLVPRLRLVGAPATLLPEPDRAALALAPPVSLGSLFASIAASTRAAVGHARQKVAVLTGCVQRLAFDDVNQATVRVLAAEGCDVTAPAEQGCCGALALHAGDIEQARALARHNIEVFEKAGVDRIVVNAAGCGSAMKEYGDLFADDPAVGGRGPQRSAPGCATSPRCWWSSASPARRASADQGARGVSRRLPPGARPGHPRAAAALLQAIPGVELVTPLEGGNLLRQRRHLQPGAAGAGGAARRAQGGEHRRDYPDLIATGNPGCILQIAAAGREMGHEWPIFHPVQLIDASIRGVDPRKH